MITKAAIITQIQSTILSGGNQTTALSVRQVLYNMLDFIEIAYKTFYFSPITDDGSNNFSGSNANYLALNEGDELRFKLSAPITGASTFNPSGLGSIPLLKFGNISTENNDGKTGQIIVCTYDGSNLQITSITDNIGEGN